MSDGNGEQTVPEREHQQRQLDRYLIPIPRGLQHVAIDLLCQQLRPTYIVRAIEDAELSYLKEEALSRVLNDKAMEAAGTFRLDNLNRHVSHGYYRPPSTAKATSDNRQLVQSCPGIWEGMVWLKLETNAPVQVMASIRGVGLMLALVDLWETKANFTEENASKLESAVQHVKNDLLLAEGATSYLARFEKAFDLWKRHARNVWGILKEEEEKDVNRPTIKFRGSCIRQGSKRLYSYPRDDFVAALMDEVVPTSSLSSHSWKVDLKNYDLEVVLMVLRAKCFAVGLTLRPYQLHKTISCHSNKLPPDLTPPYLCKEFAGDVVRLRPSNAQLLLHLANLQPGDVVLDPCAGIGTIPLQVSGAASHAIGFGGDVVLGNDLDTSLRSFTSRYIHHHDCSIKNKSGNMVAWDAALLPLRSSSIDVVVTDLPFGQTCLSAVKLTNFLPLWLAELGRVVLPSTGRAVLLCGAFKPVMEALQEVNAQCAAVAAKHESHNNNNNDDVVWELPCQSVFPVNITGVLAWIVCVQRGNAKGRRLANHHERVKKSMVVRRHQMESRSSKPKKQKTRKRRLQSS